ncbi:Conserved oligomeric Golgi complex subunit 8 [Taenia crassiceps]|uniref:Conserved oligomeric Golgi complex subunit 8 n=1 Tax=Taenia crassiceps TaxID=6207 RepID=A0ABR4QDR3_9CEST
MGEDPTNDSLNIDEKFEVEKLIQMLLLHSDVDGFVSSDPQFVDCINKLSHLRLDELAAIPKRIQLEEDSIRHKTEQLAVENYPIFLANATTSRDVHRDFLSISESSVNLLSSIASVSSAAQATFDNIGRNASAFRVSAKFVQKYTQILDFLELPQLMDTCIQNGYCQDALNILSHTKTMAKKYGRTVPIVRMVAFQAQEISGHLFIQLCKKLREPITLPVCLKVVIYLRQFEAFTEQELRLNFLQARGICIKDQLEFALAKPIGLSSFDSPSATKLTHISGHQQAEYKAFIRAMRRIEVTRVHLFDSITQYRAVFADEEAYSPKLTDTHQQSVLADISPLHLDETTLALRCLAESGIDCLGPSTEASLFHSWLVYQVGVFLDGLSGDLNALLNLPQLTLSEISDRIQLAMANDSITLDSVDAPTTFQQILSVMTQALYFGRSFARIGCDFRPLLGVLFSREILTFFETLLTNALTELSVTLELWPWELSEPSFVSNQNEGTISDEISAPMPIASHPPIAFFCNRLLTAFNGLCVCCPVGLRDGVISATTRILSNAAETIVAAHKSRQLDSTAARAQSANLASVFTHMAVPHILSSHLWQLHLEGEEEVTSASQTVSLLTRQVCAPIFTVWGQLTAGPLGTDDTAKLSVIPDTNEVKPTLDAHLSLLTTAHGKHQPSEFQHGDAKVFVSLTKEYNDLSIKEAPHSVNSSLPQKDLECEAKVVATPSVGPISSSEMRKNKNDVLEKPNPIVVVDEADLEVVSSFPEKDCFPLNASEDLKTVRLDSTALESVKYPLSSTEKATICGANYAHLAPVQESKPETVPSTLPTTQFDEANSNLKNWPHEEIRAEAVSCHLTKPNQEEVVHEDVEALPINLMSLSVHESRIRDCTTTEVTVPLAIEGTDKDAQRDKESDEVNEESVAAISLKVAVADTARDHSQFLDIEIDKSGQRDVKTHMEHSETGNFAKLSLDAHGPAESIIMDGNTAAESQVNNQYNAVLEAEGDQSDCDTASQPYHSHLLLKENQPNIQDKEKGVQSSLTSHGLAAEAPEAGVVGLKLTLSDDIPGGGDFLSGQKTLLIQESNSFATGIRGEDLRNGPESPFLKGALLEQSKLGPPTSSTEREHVFGESQESALTPSGQQEFDILKNQEFSASIRGSDASQSCRFIKTPENDTNDSCTCFELHDNRDDLGTPAMVYSTFVLGVSDTVNDPTDQVDEKSGDDRNLIGHLATMGKVYISPLSDEDGIDVQANHESSSPKCDGTSFSDHNLTTPFSDKEGSVDKDNSIFDFDGNNAGELSASAANCPTSTLGRPDTGIGRANWDARGYPLEELDDRHAEPVNANDQNIEYYEEEFVVNKEDRLLTNIDASIGNKLKDKEVSGTAVTDVQSPLVGRAVSRSSIGELVDVGDEDAWVKNVDVGVGNLETKVAHRSPNLDNSPEPALNEENTEKELSADPGFEVGVNLSTNENIDVASTGNLVELPVVDQRIETVSAFGDEFNNCEDGRESDTDPSDFARLQNLGTDVKSICQCQLDTEQSALIGPDGSENIYETPEVLGGDTLKSQLSVAPGKTVTKLQQPEVDELASDFSADDRLAFARDSNAMGKSSSQANVNSDNRADIGVIHEEKRGAPLPKDLDGFIAQFTSATELIQQNNEAAFESTIQVSEAGSLIISGAEDPVQLPISDRTLGDVDNVDGGSADWKGGQEVDKDPSNPTTIPTKLGLIDIGPHRAGTENVDLSHPWENQDEKSGSDMSALEIGQTDDKYCPSSHLMPEHKSPEPSNPRDSEAFPSSDAVISHGIKSSYFDEPCGSQNSPEKLALPDADNLWGVGEDIDVSDAGEADLRANDKPVELDSDLAQRHAGGGLVSVRQSEIDTNMSGNEAQKFDVHENLLVTKKLAVESLEEEEAIKAKTPTPLDELTKKVEKVETDEPHLQEEASSNPSASSEKLFKLEKLPSNNDWGVDENAWGEDADITVNVTQKPRELGRSKSDCALAGKAGCETEVLSTMCISSAPPFSNANAFKSGTAYFLRTLLNWQEKRLAAGDAVASMPCIVLESHPVHLEPSRIQAVEVDGLKRVDSNLKCSPEGSFEANFGDTANSEGWDVDF